MKKALSLLTLAGILGFVAVAVAAPAPEDATTIVPVAAPATGTAPAPAVLATPAPGACATEGEAILSLDPKDGAQAVQTLPPCSNYQGKPCNTTTKRRCLHIPGEPGICVCQSGTWQCF